MSRDSLNTLIRLALLLSVVSSLLGLLAGLLGESLTKKEARLKDKQLRTELDGLHQHLAQLTMLLARAVEQEHS